MSATKLEEVDGENTCRWCFAKDDTVLYDPGSETYWHPDCYDAAGDTIHFLLELFPNKA